MLPRPSSTTPALPTILSRLSDAARALAVYASWARSPGHHARLAPGWWPPFAGQDSHLLGPPWKVSRWLRHLSPSPRLNLAQGRVRPQPVRRAPALSARH